MHLKYNSFKAEAGHPAAHMYSINLQHAQS